MKVSRSKCLSEASEDYLTVLLDSLSKHPYLWTFGICVALNSFHLGSLQSITVINRWFWCLAILACFGTMGYLLVRSQRHKERLTVLFLLGVSFLGKLFYVLCTSIQTRQHDVGTYAGTAGHTAYIQYLLDNLHLPDFDPSTRWQFYHPPLHHILCAIWVWVSEKFLGVDADSAYESLQSLTLFYTMAFLITGYRIFKLFSLKGVAVYVPLLLLCFHPCFTLLSGSINNDILSVLWISLAIYHTLQWNREPSMAGILKIALCVGFGMATKLSVGVIAFPIGLVFLIKLLQHCKERKFQIFGQYGAFLLVCVPIGLFNPIRNAILFDLPLTYVQKMSESSSQYLGEQNYLTRLFDFSGLSSCFELWLTDDTDPENNPLLAILKNFLWGEYVNGNIFVGASVVFAWLYFLFACTMAILVFGISIWVLKTRIPCCTASEKSLFAVLYLAMLVSIYSLAASEPFVCSMNSRYITPVILVEAVFLGNFLKQKKENKKIETIALRLGLFFAMYSFFLYLAIPLATYSE